MPTITCPHASCKKQFENPVMVTNFSSTPQQTYKACPFCLTKIETVTIETESTYVEIINVDDVDTSAIRQKISDIVEPQKALLENIKNLEKQKAELLEELENLKRGAEQKICTLQKEVDDLKEETRILRQLVEN
ncbi:MAG: hypothetical protein NWF03_05015 [Candidatus Bathyarchaeota archaeon]|nr:hypothetical protein [Candidatus Bathyarchaeota archaeon]